MQSVFDSRDPRYKDPFGALPTGKSADLTLRPPRSMGFSGGAAVARSEFSGGVMEYPLVWTGMEGTCDVFSGKLPAGKTPDLIWYCFRFFRSDGSIRYFGAGGWRKKAPEEFQLTVYEETGTSPDWFGQGVTYQIFPDRFFAALPVVTSGFVGKRRLHGGWEEEPDYLPDENGEIRNDDFFGGNLRGILRKLDYLKTLSVETIYLNPVFEAASNHRYDTADYTRIDPMLGTEEDFRILCREAGQRGMRVILDGVFSHTGSRSVYFNAGGGYPSLGASDSMDSPYYGWYRFESWPEKYSSWWGIKTLPQVNEMAPSYLDYILTGNNSILRRWLRAGAAGWRLDVADELPDAFLELLRKAAKEEKPDAVILGEVWEDASNKVSYGLRRRYLLGKELDGVTDYPFRDALLLFLGGGRAEEFRERMETLREHYPPSAFYSAMNFLGNHDTPRVLTLLGAGEDLSGAPRSQRAEFRLSEAERLRGGRMLKLAALLMYAFPGSPTIYYGDEAGLEGFEDPFNRRPFPWGKEEKELQSWFGKLGRLRTLRPSLRRGDLEYRAARGPLLAISRRLGGEETVAAVNVGAEPAVLALPWAKETAEDALSGEALPVRDGKVSVLLSPWGGICLTE
ncbi:glycoside hydrolase family 13 protein [Papillibacter cinnamivorans]|nr:glycoside hydrolase family 13 protein [Papillibacter cinnamivorans]